MTDKNMIVYIAGPMKGCVNNNRAAFIDAAELLESTGFIVLNPASLPEGLKDERYLPIRLAMLDSADYIFMLDGYQQSLGALTEYYYAIRQGKRVLMYDEQGFVTLKEPSKP